MMSVGQHHSRILPSSHQGPSTKTNPKPSRLIALQADLQNKILKEKEEKLLKHINAEQNRRQKTLERYTDLGERQDSSSAPGGVRNFFRERNQKLAQTNSAGSAHYHTRKKEGYDKSRPLEPLNYNNQNSVSPQRGWSDHTGTLNTSKRTEKKNGDFERWRMEQDALDRQRRQNAANKKNAATYSSRHSPQSYQNEAKLVRQRRQEEEAERQAAEAERQEIERQKRALIRQKQDEKRREQAEKGRRRREESERRQRELAEDLRRQQEAEQVEKDEQVEMIKQLEAQLAAKKKDLVEIQSRKPKERDLDSPDIYHPPSSRTEAKTKPVRHKASSQLSNHSDGSTAFPVKPRKVVRKDSKSRWKPKENTNTHANTYPNKGDSSPTPTHSRTTSHELNTTFKVSRENSIPINVANDANGPFINDGPGLDMDLSPCAVCGRKFAVDRLAKHQKACKIAKKPRKQFNTTSQRIAGSGAEKFQYKLKQQAKAASKSHKKDWRAQHEDFIATIRYAKMAAAVEAKGGNVASLAPPPKSENPDYVQCPHCSRKFNETAAERHIPKCKDIKAKPTMLKKGSRR